MSCNNSPYIKHKRLINLLMEEKCSIDSNLSDYEEVVKPSPHGAHLSENEEMEENDKTLDRIDKGDDQTEGRGNRSALRKDELDKLREVLQDYYDTRVTASLYRKTEYEDIAYNVTHKVIRKVQTADDRFRANSLVPLGIPYNGLHSGKPIYFEMMLQLPVGHNNSVYIQKEKYARYARVQPSTQSVWLDCMDKNSFFISPTRVLKLFRQYVKRSVHVLRKYISGGIREKLPPRLSSLTLKEERYQVELVINNNIHVRILPSISIPDCRSDLTRKDCPSSSHVVAAPITSPLDHNNSEAENRIFWKFSFFVAEKNKMRTIADGCRIKLLRILTEMRDNEPKLQALSAYHMKTIFFHETDMRRIREWSESNISKRFLGLLRRISLYLHDCKCPSYFQQPPDFPTLNLFEDLEPRDLKCMQAVIDDIIQNPVKAFKAD